MRIAVGQLWQETNTFNRNPTCWADFEHWGIATGEAVLGSYGTTGEIGGFVSACQKWDIDVEFAGLARFVCWPWGAVDRATWTRIQKTYADQLISAGPFDAVFLALHGAMAAEGESDLTGALLKQIRLAVGPNVPIIGTLDLHANLTAQMIEHSDVLVAYHACPHLDSYQTGERAAQALRRCVEQDTRPVTCWRKIPMITAAENHNTFTGPPAPIYRRLEQLESDPRVLSAGTLMAMPWYDCPSLGWSIMLTVAEHDAGWNQVVDELASECWELRETMEDVERWPAAEVVDRALAVPGSPVVIGDGADATNSGATGDSTHLLREFLSRDAIPGGAMTFLVDPQAVALAQQAGEGSRFDAFVGGKFASEYAEPVQLIGTVRRLLDLRFILDGHIGKNFPIHMGQAAVIQSADVTVVLTETTGPGSSPLLYEAAGLDPRSCGIVVAKSPAGFRADYESFAAAMLLADCPGCAAPNWSRLSFEHADRPLWPLDSIQHPQDAHWCGEADW